jgi:hypothetical protein
MTPHGFIWSSITQMKHDTGYCASQLKRPLTGR